MGKVSGKIDQWGIALKEYYRCGKAVCPNCGSEDDLSFEIKCRKKDRVGYGRAVCKKCKTEFVFSRLIVPESYNADELDD